MGRHAQGWTCKPRGEYFHVRFRHAGRRYSISTGETDPAGAREAAARIYAEVVAGRRRRVGGALRSKLHLDQLFAEWIAACHGVLDVATIYTYEHTYVPRFIRFFKTFDAIDDATIDEYGRSRLREILKKTVYKELGALRGFLRWCKQENYLEVLPTFPEYPKTTKGKRSGKQRAKANELSEEQVIVAIGAMPILSSRVAHRKLPKGDPLRRPFVVRPRFIVAYETGLRPATLDELELGTDWTRGARELRIDDDDDKARFGRTVTLTDTAVAALEMTVKLLDLQPGDKLFGKHRYETHLERAGKAAGVKKLAAYDFRHAVSTHMADRGAPLGGIAYQDGHTQLTTTSKYAHPTRRAGEAALAVGRADLSGLLGDTGPKREQESER